MPINSWNDPRRDQSRDERAHDWGQRLVTDIEAARRRARGEQAEDGALGNHLYLSEDEARELTRRAWR